MRTTFSILAASTLLLFLTTPAVGYFEELGPRIDRGDAKAFREVRRLISVTPPGERLEDLAELSSRFVLSNPEAFLRSQPRAADCFGVDFLGVRFVDRPDALRVRELQHRVDALESVKDPSLARVRKICVARLKR
jgi:hypothetical protein